MSESKVLDIKTGKPSNKGLPNKVKAKLWDKFYQQLTSGVFDIVLADTKLSKQLLEALIEEWQEEFDKDAKERKNAKSKARMKKHRSSRNVVD